MLKKALQSVKDDYDYIIIDCAPSLGLLTLNALTAADSVIIPIQCEYFALEGLGKLLNTISIQKIHNADLDIEGLLLTMFDSDCDYRIKLLKRYKSILTIWFLILLFKEM
jgi:chromosome partitioning protein